MFRCVETVGNYIQKYCLSQVYSKSKLRNVLSLCRNTNLNVHSNHFDHLVSNLTLCDQGFGKKVLLSRYTLWRRLGGEAV
jgi:hypothetical protein